MSGSNPDPETVKRALDRLAHGDPGGVERVVREAVAAVRDVERAAAFADGGGRDRLARAVAAAERDGDHELARRGQRALAAFEWFERACEEKSPSERR